MGRIFLCYNHGNFQYYRIFIFLNNKADFPVRIAQIIGKWRNGGVESVVMNYYRNIDRTKIQYDFLIDSDSPINPPHEIQELGGKIIIIPPYQKQFIYQQELYKIFTKNKYLLVHSHLNSLSIFPLFAAWKAGIPIRIAHNHSTAGKGEFKRNIMKYTLREFSRLFPTHLCACSELAAKWLFGKNALKSGKVKIWNNAIDCERFAYSPIIREKTRRELKLENKFIVGHSGRFVNQKNHNFLIDIFAKIHKIREDSVLLLAGEGPLMDNIINKVMNLGLNDCVIFLGNVPDMAKYYQAMDLFILPSFYEGLPVVGSEVQVSGLPMLCSDTITKEMKFCDNVEYFSLNKSAREWAEEAIKLHDKTIRQDMSEYAGKSGFNIKTQAGKFFDWYCELLCL